MDDMEFGSLDPNPEASALKSALADIIMNTERNSPRSRQRAIGPSEVGSPCDRRIAYRIAGTDAINNSGDPWPAIVGTAIHDWLERAVNGFQGTHGDQGWLPEQRVYPDDIVSGRSDLFHIPTGTVVDYKTASSDKIRKLQRGAAPTTEYITQINLYGLGHERAGRMVKNVALVYYPRSGWLKDAYIWHAPYDKSIALKALNRLYDIGFQLLDLDVQNNPENFSRIQATGGDNCVWCPMFSREMNPTVLASDKGCPGR